MGSKKELAHAAAANAIAAWAKRNANRETLVEGNSHDVALKVSGTVDGERISMPVSGKLAIGLTNPSGSTKGPNLTGLLAMALAKLPSTRLESLIGELKKPADVRPDEASLILAKSVITRLSTKGPRAGAVQFVEA